MTKNTLRSPFSPFKFLQSVGTKWVILSFRLDRLSDLTCCKMFVCISNKAKMHIILAVKFRIMWARKPCKKETHLLPSSVRDELPRPPSCSVMWSLQDHCRTAEPRRANTAPGLRGSWVWPSTENRSIFIPWMRDKRTPKDVCGEATDSVAPVQYPKKYFHKINRDLYGDAMLVPIRLVCTKWNSTVELRYKWYWVAIRRSQLHSILLLPSSNPRPRL